MTKSIIRLATLFLVAWLASACTIVYRPDIQQGNVVTQEMIDQLKIGMSRRQVRFILGTPLIEDPFHQERWDYYYFRKKGKGDKERRLLQVFFDGDRLVEIRGDVQIRAKDATSAESGDEGTELRQEYTPLNLELSTAS